jgi:osmotically inducible protein OsmC
VATERTVEVEWIGAFLDGEGTIVSSTSGKLPELEVTWTARTDEESGLTSPEELLAAAHAACYAMSLAGELAGGGSAPEHLDVRAIVTLDQVEDGSHRIVASELLARARVKEIDQETLDRLAASASDGCPFSKLIAASGTVTVNATLEGETDGD